MNFMISINLLTDKSKKKSGLILVFSYLNGSNWNNFNFTENFVIIDANY